MTRTLFFAFLLSTVTLSAYGGPACSKQYQQSAECLHLCKPGWGYSGKPSEASDVGQGLFLGVDPWGLVIFNSGKTLDEWIASACGLETPLDSSSSNSTTETTTQPVPTATEITATSSSVTSSSSTSTSTTTTSSSTTTSEEPTTTTNTPEETTTATPEETPTTTPPPETTLQEEPEPTTAPKIQGGAVDGGNDNKNDDSDGSRNTDNGNVSSNNNNINGNDIETWLALHNSLRAQHGAGALSWSDEAAARAQEWASNCVFEHSGGSLGPFGENLAAGTGENYGIDTAFKGWADEESEYNSNNPQASHYTQVVWKGSTQVGCALAACDGIFEPRFGTAKYYVCEYSPQGNVLGRFAENVQ